MKCRLLLCVLFSHLAYYITKIVDHMSLGAYSDCIVLAFVSDRSVVTTAQDIILLRQAPYSGRSISGSRKPSGLGIGRIFI